MARYRLGDICTIISGSTPKTEVAEYWDGDFKWITPAELNDDSYIIEDSARKLTALGVQKTGLTPFPAGTIILSSRAPIGKVAIAGCEMYCNQGFKNLICSEIVHNKYLFWYLKGKTEYLNSLGRGATFKEISKQIVGGIEIELPPMEEQIAIAQRFEQLNLLLHERKQEITMLDQLIKARFVEMFGTEQEAYRWPSCVVADVADVTVGVVIQPTQYYCDYGVPAFRSLNVREMAVNDNDWVYFTEEGQAKNQKSIIRENDVLVVRSGAPGVACVATAKYAGYNAVDIIIAHPCMEKVNPVFLAMFTNMPHGMNQIRAKTGGAAQQHYNVGGYKALKLILPPLVLQKEFATFVSQVDKSKLSIQASLDQLETLKQSLMQEYFG